LVSTGLRVADRVGQHLPQFRLGHRGLPRDRCFPLCHGTLYGVPGRELKARNSTQWPAHGAVAAQQSLRLSGIPRVVRC
jgi:hypothetical protein